MRQKPQGPLLGLWSSGYDVTSTLGHIGSVKVTSSKPGLENLIQKETLVRPIILKNKKSGEIIKTNLYSRIFFFVMFICVLLLAFYISRPFLPALVTGALVAYLSYPLYSKSKRYIKNESLAALAITIIVALIFTIPVIIIGSLIFKEAQYYTTYIGASGNHLGANFVKAVCKNEELSLCKATRSALKSLPRSDPDYYIDVVLRKILDYIIENIQQFVSSLLSIIFSFLMMIFVIYYLYKDGYLIYQRIRQLLPVKESQKDRILARFHEITMAVFYGNISAAVLTGLLGVISFMVLGLPSPFLWGFVMAIFSFVPAIGAGVVWLPVSLNLIFVGYIEGSNAPIIKGIVLFLYGLIVLGGIEQFLKPKLIGNKANIHPLFVLIGVLGGLKLFGIIGLILGPVMLAFSVIALVVVD